MCVGRDLGRPCTVKGMCKSGACTIIKAKQVCTAKRPGKPCVNGSECNSNTCYSNKCECTSTCVFGPKCLTGCPAAKECIFLPAPYANYCGTTRPMDADCHGDYECTSGNCRFDKCSLKGPGEYCTAADECTSFSCYENMCECYTRLNCTYSATCRVGCPATTECIFAPYPNANYCGNKRPVGGDCRSNYDCVSDKCRQGKCK